MSDRSRLLLAGVIAVSTSLPAAVSACINLMGTNVHGAHVPADACSHQLPAYIADPKRDRKLADLLLRIEKNVADDPSLANRNNLAAHLLKAGDFQRALEMLLALELEHPGHYQVAANLGTAYELTGRNVEAREWIAKGISRNIDNHRGTEWIHLRILDAKLALAQNPDWLRTHSVLGTDFGLDDAPAQSVPMPPGNNPNKRVEARVAQVAVCYQMHERLPFTPKPDALVGSLLFDAGNIAFHHDTLDNALKLYQLATDYSIADPSLLERRIAHTKQLLDQLAPKQPLKRSK